MGSGWRGDRRRRGDPRARGGPARRGDPRRADARAGRPGGLPADARDRRPHARTDVDRAYRGLRAGGGARGRRRRLPGQAVRQRGADRQTSCTAATHGLGGQRAKSCASRTWSSIRVAHEARRAGDRSSLPAPSSCCWNCSCAIPLRCSHAGRSSSACGAMTSAPPRTRWRSMSAICVARPRLAESHAWCTRSEESAT